MKPSITNSKLRKLYSPELVTERFKKFGGIIRRVLPDTSSKIYERILNDAVNAIPGGLNNVESIIRADNLNQIGSYLVQWSPAVVFDENDPGKYTITNFAKLQRQFTSEFVAGKVKEQIHKMLFEELQKKLSDLLRDDPQNPMLPSVFEEYAIKYCVKNFDDIRRFLAISKPTKLTLTRGVCKYQNMEYGILYYALNKMFPACEAYFKCGKYIYLIQVSKIDDNKTCANSALAKFFAEIDLPPENIGNVKVLYFRLNAQSKWK
jgi:hypothetical protein